MTPRRFRTGYGLALRWTLVGLAILEVGVTAIDFAFEGFSPWRTLRAVFWLFFAVLGWRIWAVQTEVGPQGLRVWANRLRVREITNDEIADVHRKTSFSPVRVDLTSGETIELPGVKPEDFDEVRALLGR